MDREEAKHLSEVLKAYSEDKIVEYRKKNTAICTWVIYKGQSIDENFYEYRIKPEPKLRPYANAEEFLQAQKEHGPYILYDKFGYNIITQINQDSIWINPYQYHQKISFGKLVNYKWQDGSPCGILE